MLVNIKQSNKLHEFGSLSAAIIKLEEVIHGELTLTEHKHPAGLLLWEKIMLIVNVNFSIACLLPSAYKQR